MPLKLLITMRANVCSQIYIFVAVAPITARFLLACVFRELVILMRYEYVVSGLDICLSSCSMMSDSCSDVFACSFSLKSSWYLVKMCYASH